MIYSPGTMQLPLINARASGDGDTKLPSRPPERKFMGLAVAVALGLGISLNLWLQVESGPSGDGDAHLGPRRVPGLSCLCPSWPGVKVGGLSPLPSCLHRTSVFPYFTVDPPPHLAAAPPPEVFVFLPFGASLLQSGAPHPPSVLTLLPFLPPRAWPPPLVETFFTMSAASEGTNRGTFSSLDLSLDFSPALANPSNTSLFTQPRRRFCSLELLRPLFSGLFLPTTTPQMRGSGVAGCCPHLAALLST